MVCNRLSSGILIPRRLVVFYRNSVILTGFCGIINPNVSYAVQIWGNSPMSINYQS